MAVKTWTLTSGTSAWSSSGCWTPTGAPATGDDVVFTAAGSGNCAVSGTAVNSLNSLNASGYAGIFSGSNQITVLGTSGATTNIMLGNSQHTYSGTLYPSAVSGAIINITWGNKTLAQTINASGLGTVVFVNNALSTLGLTHTTGTLQLDGATNNSGLTHSFGSITSSNTNTRTLNFGNSNITVVTISLSDTTNLTLSQGSLGNITAPNFYCAMIAGNTTQTLSGTLIMGSATGTLSAKLTIPTFKALGPASKNTLLKVISGSQLKATNTFTISGNSAINRLYFGQDYTTNISTAAYPTIDLTGATVSGNGFDVGGIAFISPTPLDFSAVSNYSGDCGGNTLIGGTLTFTPSSIQTLNISGTDFTAASTTLFSTGAWTSRMPLPQDRTVISTTGSGVVNLDITRIGNLSLSGGVTDLTGSLTYLFGSLNLTNHRMRPGNSIDTSSFYPAFVNMTSGSVFPITCGNVRQNNSIRFFATSKAVFQFRDTFWAQGWNFDEQGDFDAETYNVDVYIQKFDSFPVGGSTIKMGNGTWYVSSGPDCRLGSTYTVFEPGNSTLFICAGVDYTTRLPGGGTGQSGVIENYSSTRHTLNNIMMYENLSISQWPNFTFKNLTMHPDMTGDLTFLVYPIYADKLTFTGTISGVSLAKRLIFKSRTAGTPATVIKEGPGITTLEFVELQDIAFSPANVVNIAENCYVGTNVTGCMIPAKGMRFGD